jgi:hypothetical protein
MDFGRFSDLPAFELEGYSYANFSKRRCRIRVVFSKTDTYVIHSWSPADTPLPEDEEVASVVGEPNEHTERAFAYLLERLPSALPDLQKFVEQLVKKQEEKTQQSSEPKKADDSRN